MLYGRYIYSIRGVYKPTYNWGAGILMLTSRRYIDGIHGTPYIYSKKMDPMGVEWWKIWELHLIETMLIYIAD